MAGPFLPILSISRSQNVRVGNGPGNAVPPQLTQNPSTADIPAPLYVDLGQPEVRRDLAHHFTTGAIIVAGPIVDGSSTSSTFPGAIDSALTVTSDLGSGPLEAILATIESYLAPQYLVQGWTAKNDVLSVVTSGGITGGTVTLAFNYGGSGRYISAPIPFNATSDVVADAVSAATSVPQYEADVLTSTATGGTFVYSFYYRGHQFTTAPISVTASTSAIGTAVNAATTTGPPLPSPIVASGAGPLGTGSVTLTASGSMLGPIMGQFVDNTAATGGTVSVAVGTPGLEPGPALPDTFVVESPGALNGAGAAVTLTASANNLAPLTNLAINVSGATGGTPAGTFTTVQTSIQPDPTFGEQVVIMPLTSNLFVSNPAMVTQRSGRRIILQWTQDATGGRTVTFDTQWRPGTTTATTGANQVWTQTFVWDGLHWSATSAPYRLV